MNNQDLHRAYNLLRPASELLETRNKKGNTFDVEPVHSNRLIEKMTPRDQESSSMMGQRVEDRLRSYKDKYQGDIMLKRRELQSSEQNLISSPCINPVSEKLVSKMNVKE